MIKVHKFNFSEGDINNTTKYNKLTNNFSKETTNYDNTQTENSRQNFNTKITRSTFPAISSKKENQANKTIINHENINKFFCPFCEHCNNLKDTEYDNYTYNLSQANTIINKGFDYIIQNLKNFDKNCIDLFSNSYGSLLDYKDENIKDENNYSQENNNVHNEDIINVNIFF